MTSGATRTGHMHPSKATAARMAPAYPVSPLWTASPLCGGHHTHHAVRGRRSQHLREGACFLFHPRVHPHPRLSYMQPQVAAWSPWVRRLWRGQGQVGCAVDKYLLLERSWIRLHCLLAESPSHLLVCSRQQESQLQACMGLLAIHLILSAPTNAECHECTSSCDQSKSWMARSGQVL
jgi:hypothetical protein